MNADSQNVRPGPDTLLAEIADYVCAGPEFGALAYETAVAHEFKDVAPRALARFAPRDVDIGGAGVEDRPVTIEKHVRRVVVVLSVEEYERLIENRLKPVRGAGAIAARKRVRG